VVIHEVLVPQQVDVMAIRKHMHMSRRTFCDQFGFSIRTLEKWERGQHMLESSTRACLTVITSNSNAIITALHQ